MCPRCLEFEEEVQELRRRLAATGQYVDYSAGPNPIPIVDRELELWIAVHPRADAAAGFRAGWARLARLVSPSLRDREARWFRAMRDNDRLKSGSGPAHRARA